MVHLSKTSFAHGGVCKCMFVSAGRWPEAPYLGQYSFMLQLGWATRPLLLLSRCEGLQSAGVATVELMSTPPSPRSGSLPCKSVCMCLCERASASTTVLLLLLHYSCTRYTLPHSAILRASCDVYLRECLTTSVPRCLLVRPFRCHRRLGELIENVEQQSHSCPCGPGLVTVGEAKIIMMGIMFVGFLLLYIDRLVERGQKKKKRKKPRICKWCRFERVLATREPWSNMICMVILSLLQMFHVLTSVITIK